MHDPLSALAESEATGNTAELFADIRQAMHIPLVTSIWRILAGVEGALSATWDVAKPLIETGQPDAALYRLTHEVSWPVPGQPIRDGAWKVDMAAIRAIVEAYNRSNGLSLLALSALIAEPAGRFATYPVPEILGVSPVLPPLRSRGPIEDDTWALIERANRIGATPDQPGVATLWRHLAYWPELLAAVERGFAPLQKDGTIARALDETQVVVRAEAARLAYLRSPVADIPSAARTVITQYVTHPGLVVRMVVIGQGLANWLRDGPEQR